MAFSEYILLVSLSAGIHAHADTGGIAIGPEAITQPNGGVTPAAFKVADKHKGEITATAASGQHFPKALSTQSSFKNSASGPPMRTPAVRAPAIHLK